MRTEIKIALTLAGMSQEEIAAIEKALPAVERLVALVQKLAPQIPSTLTGDIANVAPVAGNLLKFIKGT